MKIAITFCIFCIATIVGFSQTKKLQSYHVSKFVSGEWAKRTIYEYFYYPGINTERTKRINTATNTFEIKDSTTKFINLICNSTEKIEKYDLVNNTYVKRDEFSNFEVNDDCKITKVIFSNALTLDTIQRNEYFDYNSNGNHTRERSYSSDNAQKIFTLENDIELSYTYDASNQIKTIITKNVKDNINELFDKYEFTYTNGKLASETYYLYSGSDWVLNTKNTYVYSPGVEIKTHLAFENDKIIPYFVNVDSTNIDSDGDISSIYLYTSPEDSLEITWKLEYFYEQEVTSIEDESMNKLGLKFFTEDVNHMHFQIDNTDRKELEVIIYDIYGRELYNHSYGPDGSIEETITANIGYKVFTINEKGKQLHRSLRVF